MTQAPAPAPSPPQTLFQAPQAFRPPQPPQAAQNLSIGQALDLAREHFSAGRRAEVETLCLRVLEVEPENAQALHLTGLLAHLAGKQAIALALIEKSLRIDPAEPQFHYNLGVVQGVLRRPQQALEAYRQAVALDPRHPNAWANLGNAALELDRFDEAIAAFERDQAIRPEHFDPVLSRAIAQYAARRFDASEESFAQALRIAPHQPRVRWEHAHLRLMRGDYARGWEEYEHRFAAPQSSVWCYPYPFPRWSGEPLAGKTILLHGEQGLGDEIMFGSIYPEVIAAAAHAIICCQPHLESLFRDSFPAARVVPQLRADGDAWRRHPADWLAGAPRIDYQIPFGSLARLKRRSREDFPADPGDRGAESAPGDQRADPAPGYLRADPAPGYLRADPARVAAWRDKLGGLRGYRVGLCWAANPAIADPLAARRSRKKSLTLKQLEPLLEVQRVDYVSLQTWEAAAQVAAADPATRARILDASAGLQDFADTAALIMNLDLVITVDTSVAHLAGALGKPVWILLPWQADWRWHADGSRTEWYPSARLYRQEQLEDWAGVVAQARADLAAALPRDVSGVPGPAAPAERRA